jgi:ATP-dependent exoDNAse (exonuclease V) beta subunit
MSMTPAEHAPGDAAARRAALDVRRSLLLQAPAGSGKTTVLTQRFLSLLLDVEVPEQVLAITFTRKAAAEMRQRVTEAIRGPGVASRRDAAAQVTRDLAARVRARSCERGWDLEHNASRLGIYTIDGFNRSLAGSLPLSSSIDAELAIAERPERLYLDAARAALDAAEREPELQSHSGAILERLDNRWGRLEALLADLLASRAHWLPHVVGQPPESLVEAVETSCVRVVEHGLRRAYAAMGDALVREGFELAIAAAQELDASGRAGHADWRGALGASVPAPGPSSTAASTLPLWRAVVGLACTAEGNGGQRELRAKVNVTNGFPPGGPVTARARQWLHDLAAAGAAPAALGQVGRLPDLRLGADDAATLVAVAVLLPYAAAHLRLVLRAAARVDHVEVAAAARAALGDDTEGSDLARHRGAALRHVLVDEFQDTSLQQFELLQSLTQDWEGDATRTLFAVGDPMQSIYQFREAQVGLFLRARDRGVGALRLEALALDRNFRSDPRIVQWVNERFAGIFPARDDLEEGAVRFLPSAAAQAAGAASDGVHVHALRDADEQAEAAEVLRVVRALRDRDPQARIAVLVGVRSHASALTARLRADAVPVVGVDLVRLVDLPAIQDLAALARAIADPDDRVAWLSLLRAPWCGLPLGELTDFAGDDSAMTVLERMHDEAALATLDAELRGRVCRLRAVLDVALAQRAGGTLANALEAAWLALGAPSIHAGADALAAARVLLDRIALRERAGEWRGARDLEPLLTELFAPSDAATPGAVEVMTVHRAKGLEFDHVLLPGLHRAGRADADRLLNWLEWPDEDGVNQLLLAPIRDSSAEASRLGRWIRHQRATRLRRERARLLYVACTRARRQLHLFGAVPCDRPDGARAAPDPRSLLAILWPACEAEFRDGLAAAPAATDATVAGSEPSIAAPLLRVAAGWQVPSLPQRVSIDAVPVSSIVVGESPDFDWAGETARIVGTVVHAELERCARLGTLSEAAGAADAADGAGLSRIARALTVAGIEARELPAAEERVLRALRATLADPLGRDILRPRPGAHSELALTGLYEGRLTSIVVDRCFVDEQGVRWVVDFKTSEHEGSDLSRFVASEVERYLPQLRRYARLAAALGPEPVRAALYFPLLGARFVEVPLD